MLLHKNKILKSTYVLISESKMLRSKILFLAIVAGIISFAYSSIVPVIVPGYRLPKTIIPKNYKIKLQPNLKDFSYTADIEINAEVVSDTHEIVLNSGNLKYKSIDLKRRNSPTSLHNIETNHTLYEKYEKLIINVTDDYDYLTKSDDIVIYITLDRNEMRDDKIGFYKSIYHNEDIDDER